MRRPKFRHDELVILKKGTTNIWNVEVCRLDTMAVVIYISKVQKGFIYWVRAENEYGYNKTWIREEHITEATELAKALYE